MARYWGYWTRGKLDLLRDYLDEFTTTTKVRSPEVLYLDLFAGMAENRERWTDAEIQGSARIALNTEDPPFTRLRFFELEGRAGELEARLRPDHPSRDFDVVVKSRVVV